MKRILCFFIFGLGIFALAGSALADPPDGSFSRFFTVDSDGSTTEKDTFALSETPWAFGHVPGVGANRHAAVQTDWFFNSVLMGEADLTGGSGVNDFWATPLNWDSIKQAGDWTLKGFFQVHEDSDNSIFRTGNNTYFFTVAPAPTVTPEPVSVALFGLGAGALGIHSRLRKRQRS